MDGQSSSDDHHLPRPQTVRKSWKAYYKHRQQRVHRRLSRWHARIPYLRKLPLRAILIIAFLIFVNLVVWAICGLILSSHTHLLSTAALAYTLGLRHALDADHISAIDLMTRRLIATGQRPVTVGTFFSLGHSTIVIITSIVVAATAAGIAGRFDSFGTVGGIIGTSVSAAFLILLGIMNAYILYKLIVQIRKVIRLQPEQEGQEAWKIEGGGCFFRLLKRMFKLIDRPWKMYPLGVLFGMGFDTSSEIALLGISSIQGAKGTSIWLILIFPVLFTAGMCLVDTTDGALMMSLYVAPMGMGGDDKKDTSNRQAQAQGQGQRVDTEADTDTDIFTATTEPLILDDVERSAAAANPYTQPHPAALSSSATQETTAVQLQLRPGVKDPLTFLYYSIVLTSLTVVCAIVIGILQLLSLILNVASPTGRFWDGVATAGDYYEVIGGAICGSFVVFGALGVLCYKPWRAWVERQRAQLRTERAGAAVVAAAAAAVSDNTRTGNETVYDVDDEPGAVYVGEAELVDIDANTDGKGGTSTVTRGRVDGKAFDSPAQAANVGPPGASGGGGGGASRA
ncbi:putative nickel transport protein [Cladophialophora carrionii]|uniref:Putative nickel transport protein n=1 Tax=Cladophialophora carrionii TaxID=86049 RepID=A0A1C1CIG4_9EURO|nr:putative nickel transport protein [Cladophialophora carrionii]